ncbi:hypothetical protein [Planctomycetes bacterium Pan216]
MKVRNVLLGVIAAGTIWFASASSAQAQVVVSYYTPAVPVVAPAPMVAAPVVAAPVVSYYTPPIVAAPVVSYYEPAVVAAPAPVVSYYAPPAVSYYPATVRRGLFGKTIVKTPFYKVKY